MDPPIAIFLVVRGAPEKESRKPRRRRERGRVRGQRKVASEKEEEDASERGDAFRSDRGRNGEHAYFVVRRGSCT